MPAKKPIDAEIQAKLDAEQAAELAAKRDAMVTADLHRKKLEALEAEEKALKAAANPLPVAALLPEGHVVVRITKHGSGKVFTGEHVNVGNDMPTYKANELIPLPLDVAKQLEARAFAEIQD